MFLLLQAYKREMWYPQYHFLLNGWYSDGWWRADNKYSDCTAQEIEQVKYNVLHRTPRGLAELLMHNRATEQGKHSVF